jgi:hypothetical protein
MRRLTTVAGERTHPLAREPVLMLGQRIPAPMYKYRW